jgi:hypothetical protein
MKSIRRSIDDPADERVVTTYIRGPDGVARRLATVFRYDDGE